MKISPITSFHRLANQPIAKRAVSKTDSTLPEYMSIPNSAYISQIQPNFKQNSRIVRDIEIDDYRKMPEDEKEDLRVFIKRISGNAGRGIDENNGDSAGRENGRFSIAVFCNGKENAKKSYADCC